MTNLDFVSSELSLEPAYRHSPKSETGREKKWSEAEETQLRELWDTGKPASVIAELLGNGISRSGVCAKVRRMNLPNREPGSWSTAPIRVKDKLLHLEKPTQPTPTDEQDAPTLYFEASPKPPVVVFEYTPVRPAQIGVTLFDLRLDCCRFPLWKTGERPSVHEAFYCGEPVRLSKIRTHVYCTKHTLVATIRS